MPERLRHLLFHHLEWKALALVLAVVVWALLAGRERVFSEKTLKIPVGVSNISNTIEIRSITPETIQLTVQGIANKIDRLDADDFPIKLNLRGVSETGKLTYFTEDLLTAPEGVTIAAVHPKRIDVTVEEFVSREVPVKVLLGGRLPAGLILQETRVVPERVWVVGFKSQLTGVSSAQTEVIDLSTLTATTTRRVTLTLGKEILKFKDSREVEVTLVIATKNDKTP